MYPNRNSILPSNLIMLFMHILSAMSLHCANIWFLISVTSPDSKTKQCTNMMSRQGTHCCMSTQNCLQQWTPTVVENTHPICHFLSHRKITLMIIRPLKSLSSHVQQVILVCPKGTFFLSAGQWANLSLEPWVALYLLDPWPLKKKYLWPLSQASNTDWWTLWWTEWSTLPLKNDVPLLSLLIYQGIKGLEVEQWSLFPQATNNLSGGYTCQILSAQ